MPGITRRVFNLETTQALDDIQADSPVGCMPLLGAGAGFFCIFFSAYYPTYVAVVSNLVWLLQTGRQLADAHPSHRRASRKGRRRAVRCTGAVAPRL